MHIKLITLSSLLLLVGLPDGSKMIRSNATGDLTEISNVTKNVIDGLIIQGAYELVDSLLDNA